MTNIPKKIVINDQRAAQIRKGRRVIVWRKERGTWNLETLNKGKQYMIFGGIEASGKKSIPFGAWYVSDQNNSTESKNFATEKEAMRFVEKNYSEEHYIRD